MLKNSLKFISSLVYTSLLGFFIIEITFVSISLFIKWAYIPLFLIGAWVIGSITRDIWKAIKNDDE